MSHCLLRLREITTTRNQKIKEKNLTLLSLETKQDVSPLHTMIFETKNQ